MMDYLFDTNHASECLKANRHIKKRIQQHRSDTFGFCSPVVAELWFMVHNSHRVEENRHDLETLLLQFETWPFDPSSTEIFGRLKSHLRREGLIVADVDLQIASIAIANNLTLLTADQAFANIPDLTSENWLT